LDYQFKKRLAIGNWRLAVFNANIVIQNNESRTMKGIFWNAILIVPKTGG